MFNKFLKGLAVAAGILMASSASAQQGIYNSIATAYVTTTISQFVVFDSTMQQGGTFDFSVLAHNGGGRAGQSDTANVKIEFFTSSNALVTSANTSYSANLPNPNALCGNPCIDPSVPWTTLTISKTLTQAQAATVAYAKVSMYGIDGSYWAGDYGPWYRAPTLTLNGSGNNMLYNPEFGPYNGITAQGWTSSPGFGACQGAWGGSNACIVNSSGVPGQSTTGLVANQNGGGPSATGGTTSGQAGGYNSTMSTSNPAGAPAATTSTNASGTTITTSLGQTTDGTITNNGTINTTGTDAGISATTATTTTITNAGTITTDNGTGINAQQNSSTTGNITVTNSGDITANTSGNTGNGGSYTAHGVLVSYNGGSTNTGTATVNNTSTGTIAVTNGDGVIMMGYGTNILNNNGSITSTPTTGNSMPSVLMNNAATINNNGSITGDVGVDFINTTAGSTINNNATGTITGNSGLAIINLGTSTGGIINNAGTITGDIQLSTNGVLNQLGTGSVAGAVRTTDSSAVVNIGTNATTATTTLAGNLGDPASTSAPSGTYSNFPRAFTFQPLSAVNINTGSTLTDNTGYTINAATVTNNGTIAVGAGANLTATAAVTSNGNITTWFNGPSYGQFTINGTLTLGNNATYTPVIVGNTSTNVTLNSPYTGVVSATGGITGAFVTTSGSVAGVNWTIAQNGNSMDVTWTPSVYVVGTAPGNPIVTSTSTNGSTVTTTTSTPGVPVQVANITTGIPTVTMGTAFAGQRQGSNLVITRTVTVTTSTPFSTVITTTTPITTVVTNTTPVTTVTDTTPTTVTTYSDGSTVTSNGATTQSTNTSNSVASTTTTTNQVTSNTVTGTQVVANPYVATRTANVGAMTDAMKTSRTNPFIVDALSTKDGAWIIPSYSRTATTGHMNSKSVQGGWQQTAENNTSGFAFSATQSESAGFVNTRTSGDTYAGAIYVLSKQDYVWLKGTLGMSKGVYTTQTSLQDIGFGGVSKAAQTNIYGDLTVYSAESFWGFRPLAGATVVRSSVSNAWDSNALLVTAPAARTTVQVNPYAGLRYEFNDNVSLEARTTQTKDFGNVKSIKATVKQEIFEDISVNASISYAKGNRYTNTTGMIGLDWKF
jgi:fibronectin-binding autotransporter adhesin